MKADMGYEDLNDNLLIVGSENKRQVRKKKNKH